MWKNRIADVDTPQSIKLLEKSRSRYSSVLYSDEVVIGNYCRGEFGEMLHWPCCRSGPPCPTFGRMNLVSMTLRIWNINTRRVTLSLPRVSPTGFNYRRASWTERIAKKMFQCQLASSTRRSTSRQISERCSWDCMAYTSARVYPNVYNQLRQAYNLLHASRSLSTRYSAETPRPLIHRFKSSIYTCRGWIFNVSCDASLLWEILNGKPVIFLWPV